MKLKYLTTINWSNIPDRTYEFANVNLFSGDSGAGKTTLLDALQTILSAAMRSVYQFNPAQEEVKQSSRKRRSRTLESYALGADQELFARTESITYIAAVFHPERGEPSEKFTALICVKAHLNEVKAGRSTTSQPKLDDLKLYVLPGQEIVQSHLVGANSTIIPPESLSDHFKSSGIVLTKPLEKKAYLSTLYGAFQGKSQLPIHEAQRSAKGLLKCMAYKPLQSIDTFVKNEVLEPPKGLDEVIDQVRGMIRDISVLKREADQVEDACYNVNNANSNLKGLIDNITLGRKTEYVDAVLQLRKIDDQIAEVNDAIHQARDERTALQNEASNVEETIEKLNEDLLEAKLALQQSDTLAQKSALEAKIKDTRKALSLKLAELDNELLIAGSWVGHTKESASLYEQIESPSMAATEINKMVSVLVDDMSSVPSLPSEGQASFAKFRKDIDSYCLDVSECVRFAIDHKGTIREGYFKTKQDLEKLITEVELHRSAIATIDKGNRLLPDQTKSALSRLKESIPESKPSVVADHVKVRDSDWQSAIEGVLGWDRFAIVVEQGFEVEAQKILLKNGIYKQTVLQGTRLLDSKTVANKESVYHFLESDNPLVDKFLQFRLGTIVSVDDEAVLNSINRGLMKDGRFASGFKLSRVFVPKNSLAFDGANTLNKREDLVETLSLLAKDIDNKKTELDYFDKLQSLCDLTKESNLEQCVSSMSPLYTELSSLQQSLGEVSVDSSDAAIEKKLLSIQLEVKELSEKRLTLAGSIGQIEKTIDNLYDNETSLESKKEDSLSNLHHKHQVLISHLSTIGENEELVRDSIDEEASNIKHIKQLDGYVDSGTLYTRCFEQLSSFTTSLSGFNSNDSQTSIENTVSEPLNVFLSKIEDDRVRRFVSDFPLDILGKMHSLLQLIEEKCKHLEGHILREKKEQIAMMVSDFNKTFICDLCFVVHGNILDGRQSLRSLNSKLQGYFFGGDTFQFADKPHPQMIQYEKFFEAVREMVGDIRQIDDIDKYFEDNFAPEIFEVFYELKSNLLNDDEDKAYKVLLKIMDYREYMLVDIMKYRKTESGLSDAISLDEDATGSGGQLETPAYVIRSASLISSLQSDKEPSSLKIMMIDEAFNKSDDARVKAIIGYLSESLGFQLMIAMPTRSTLSLLSSFDKMFSVTKQPNIDPNSRMDSSTFIHEKLLHRDAIERLWRKTKMMIDSGSASSFLSKMRTQA